MVEFKRFLILLKLSGQHLTPCSVFFHIRISIMASYQTKFWWKEKNGNTYQENRMQYQDNQFYQLSFLPTKIVKSK